MKVTAIAATMLLNAPTSVRETKVGRDLDFPSMDAAADIDILHEFAGRACYKAWDKPNPATAANEDYLGNIIDSEHLSVLEHGQVTFYVENVSRSLLLELERHGRNSHLSFSVESQRYVKTSKYHPEPIIPPLLADLQVFGNDEGYVLQERLRKHYTESLALYDETFTRLREVDIPVKQAREAARAFLPNATPVDFVVTADIRGWREVIAKRDAPGADAEIRALAQAIEEALIEIAPNSMQEAA